MLAACGALLASSTLTFALWPRGSESHRSARRRVTRSEAGVKPESGPLALAPAATWSESDPRIARVQGFDSRMPAIRRSEQGSRQCWNDKELRGATPSRLRPDSVPTPSRLRPGSTPGRPRVDPVALATAGAAHDVAVDSSPVHRTMRLSLRHWRP